MVDETVTSQRQQQSGKGKEDPNEKGRKRRASRRPYCQPCKLRRVKCTMEKPVCTRCLRKTRAHECIYEDEPQESPASSSHSQEITVQKRLPERAESQGSSSSPYEFLAWTAEQLSPRMANLRFDDGPFPTQARFTPVDGAEHAALAKTLKLRLEPDRNEMFEAAFYTQWLPTSAMLAWPRPWTFSIRKIDSKMPALDAAMRAIGAMKMSYRVDAAMEYSKCLHILQTRLQTESSSIAGLETCASIVLLICFEALSGAQISHYQNHLQGVSFLLKQQVVQLRRTASPVALQEYEETQWLHNRDGFIRGRSVPMIGGLLARLMYKTARNIMTLECFLQQEPPKLSAEDWNALIPFQTCEDDQARDHHIIFQHMNQAAGLLFGEKTTTSILGIHGLLSAVLETGRALQWPQHILSVGPPATGFDSLGLDSGSPYPKYFHVPGNSEVETVHRSTITCLLLAIRLSLSCAVALEAGALVAMTETIVGLVQTVVQSGPSKHARGLTLPWCVFALAAVQRALCHLTSPPSSLSPQGDGEAQRQTVTMHNRLRPRPKGKGGTAQDERARWVGQLLHACYVAMIV